jgi:hypothetical protein
MLREDFCSLIGWWCCIHAIAHVCDVSFGSIPKTSEFRQLPRSRLVLHYTNTTLRTYSIVSNLSSKTIRDCFYNNLLYICIYFMKIYKFIIYIRVLYIYIYDYQNLGLFWYIDYIRWIYLSGQYRVIFSNFRI